MPQKTRETQSESYPYFFAVSSITGPFADWKRFKDLVRALVPSNSPGWTNISPQPVCDGRGFLGYFSVRTWEDAYAAYAGLVKPRADGTYWGVHLLDTSGATGVGYRLIDCNCSASGLASKGSCAVYQKSQCHYGALPTVNPVHTVRTTHCPGAALASQLGNTIDMSPALGVPQTVPYGVPFAALTQQTSRLEPFSDPGHQIYQPLPAQQLPPPNAQLYASQGLPINAAYGVYKLEHKAVIITNLNYNTKEHQLRDLLATIAQPLRINLSTDRQGMNKGNAIVYFSSASEVQKVVKRLSNFKFDGKHLKVRPDRSGTATQSLHLPVVVHSSTHQTSSF